MQVPTLGLRSSFLAGLKGLRLICGREASEEVKVAQRRLTLQLHGLYSPWDSPGQNPAVGNLSLLQEGR